MPKNDDYGTDYSMTELGVRASEWEEICRRLLPKSLFTTIEKHLRKKAVERNRAANAQPDVSGRSASHRSLFDK